MVVLLLSELQPARTAPNKAKNICRLLNMLYPVKALRVNREHRCTRYKLQQAIFLKWMQRTLPCRSHCAGHITVSNKNV
ncbi:hypothetical protein VCR26J2_410104 [Vibrio coralliirubri]|nr:hypothetical protein VCR26J2_410104 [Vibrio coralliirubri]